MPSDVSGHPRCSWAGREQPQLGGGLWLVGYQGAGAGRKHSDPLSPYLLPSCQNKGPKRGDLVTPGTWVPRAERTD